jgi:hypothetical protein
VLETKEKRRKWKKTRWLAEKGGVFQTKDFKPRMTM